MPEQQSSDSARKFYYVISLVLIVLGIAFYWSWGLMFGIWSPLEAEGIGAYAITVLMIGFGLVGVLLNRKKKS